VRRIVIVLVALFASSRATAQTIDAAQATALFRDGREALAAGDYARACAAFAESLRLDVKVGTLLNLADCEEHSGALAQAFAHWQQGIDRATAGHDERLAFLEGRLAALDARVPKLTIRRGPDAPVQTEVARDGIAIGEASLGRAIPVDPGKHAVVAWAKGRAPKTYAIELREGARVVLDVAPGAPVAEPPPPVAHAEEPPAERWSTQRSLAVTAAAVGAIGLGVGIGFGISALSKKGSLGKDGHCTSAGACDDQASATAWNATRDDAQSAGRISTIGFVVGGAALATGAVLWFTAAPQKARMRVGLGRVELVGSW
jgi:tetratricopeptide (TPR) repeat protein